MNTLFYGDNLDILRERIPSESVDLIYLDPPFNSNRSYNVLFRNRKGSESAAQIEAFDDTWTWSDEQSGALLEELVQGGAPPSVRELLLAFRRFLGTSDMMAYLVMMTARLVELHRVLKSTGSLYLHCDPTASHYLKVVLDTLFGAKNFRNEVIWKRTSGHGDAATRFASVHDVLLFYSKSDKLTWHRQFQPYDPEYIETHFIHQDPDGRKFRRVDLRSPSPRPNLTYDYKGYKPHPNGWAVSYEKMEQLDRENRLFYPKKGEAGRLRRKLYLDESAGDLVTDVWTDIKPIFSVAAERLGYPTQKPLALLRRIIQTSSNPGDVVLDAFCGCGTAIDAAQQLGRRWIGIDITVLAIDLIKTRLEDTYGANVAGTFAIKGTPTELESAQRLFSDKPFEFERWAVTLVDGEPNEKQVGDKGIDGIIRFAIDRDLRSDEALVSVKGGRQLNPSMVRDLAGTVSSRRAAMGVMITLEPPTRGMIEAAQTSGLYTWPISNEDYPRAQIVTIEDLLLHRRQPRLPPLKLRPYLKAERLRTPLEQLQF